MQPSAFNRPSRWVGLSERDGLDSGSVSKVEMWTPRALIYRVLFPSISTFETPPFFKLLEIEHPFLPRYNTFQGKGWGRGGETLSPASGRQELPYKAPPRGSLGTAGVAARKPSPSDRRCSSHVRSLESHHREDIGLVRWPGLAPQHFVREERAHHPGAGCTPCGTFHALARLADAPLLDDLVRQHEEVRGQRDPEGLGRLEVDD
jgi:hypothetical protein